MAASISIWKLMSEYKEKNPGGHFFDKETLKFFGERLSEMRVFQKTEIIEDYKGNKHECYVLSSLQRKHPLGPRRKYSYFDVETFEHILI